MHDQVLVAVRRHAPIEPPLEHGKGLIRRQRNEGWLTVEEETHLRLEPAPQAGIARDFDVKVGKSIDRANVEIRVDQRNVVDKRGDIGFQTGDQGS